MITPFSVVPSRQRPAQFAPEMDQFLGEMARFVTEANALEQSLQIVATTGTSTSTLTVVVGAANLQTQAGKAWVAGACVYLASTASVGNMMMAQVVSYDQATGAMSVNVLATRGAGTFSSWVVGLSAPVASSASFPDGVSVDNNLAMGVFGAASFIRFGDNDTLYFNRLSGQMSLMIDGAYVFGASASEGPYRWGDATTPDALIRKAQLDAAVQQASPTVRGTTRLATSAEVSAGVSTQLAVTPEALQSGKIVQSSKVATTSGTAFDFPGIPAWAKRVTVALSNVSTNGTGFVGVQLGYGATPTFLAGGYSGCVWRDSISASVSNMIAASNHAGASDQRNGTIVLTRLGGNIWVSASNIGLFTSANFGGGAFSVDLGAELTAIRLTTSNGTDTFDLGWVSVSWE